MKRNKIFILASMLIIALVLSIFSFSKSLQIEAASNPIKVTVKSALGDSYQKTYQGKTLILNKGYSVSFQICLSNIPSNFSGQVRVYYHTEDYEAMSCYNEYIPVDSFTTIYKSSPYSQINISVNYSNFGIKDTPHRFKFVLSKAEIINDTTSGATVEIVDRETFGTTMTASTSTLMQYGSVYHYSEYGQTETYSPGTMTNKDNQSAARLYETTYYRYMYSSKMYDWNDLFISSGNATLAVGGYIWFKSDHGLNWFDDDNTYIEFSYDDKVYYINEENQKNKGNGNKFGIGGGGDGDSTYKNGSKSVYTTGRTYSNYVTMPGDIDGIDMMFKSWDCTQGEWHSGTFEAIIIDEVLPNVVKWSVGNPNPVYGENIYISVRFNEPVWVKNPNSLTLKCALTSSYVYQDDELYSLAYDGGSGTDTLVFKLDTTKIINNKTKNLICKQIYPLGLAESNGTRPLVYDYGANAYRNNNLCVDYSYKGDGLSAFSQNGSVDPKSLKCPLEVNIDLRQPEISVSRYFSSTISNQNQCSIVVNNASEDSDIYYMFSDSNEPLNIDNSTDLKSLYEFSMKNTNGSSILGNTLSITGTKLNGHKYLHVSMRTPFGLNLKDLVVAVDKNDLSKPIKFDSTIPVCTNYDDSTSNYKIKTIDIDVLENPSICPSGIKYVRMFYTNNQASYANYKASGVKDENLKEANVYYAEASTPSTNKMTLVSNTNNNTYKFQIVIDSESPSSLIYLPADSYDTYYIGFAFEDYAGNVTQYTDVNFTKYDFDTRNLFDSTYTATEYTYQLYGIDKENMHVIQTLGQDEKVFKISKEDPVGELSIASVKKMTTNIETGQMNFEEFDIDTFASQTPVGTTELMVGIKPGLIGYYEVIFQYDVKFSRPYYFYLTSTKTDDTSNYNEIFNGGELINTVYMLNSSKYYYKDINETVIEANYNDVNLLPVFSTLSYSVNYVKFIEYQDFSIYKITNQDQADTLENRNVAERLLASGETHKPKVGDYYIRYKKSDWVFGDTSPANWVYYFYSTDTAEINTSKLSTILSEALDNVVLTIVKNGGETFLTDGYLDKYGSPKLDPLQYHRFDEITNSTRCNDEIIGASYGGDSGIFQSNITTGVDSYERLLTSYEFSFDKSTRIFYRAKVFGSSYHELEEYSPNLRMAAKTTGVFDVMELDSNGVRVFSVYLDYTEPQIKVTYEALDADGNTITRSPTYGHDNDGQTVNARKLTFDGMIESDDFGYVAIYKINSIGYSLYEVYSKKEIESTRPTIDNGNFLLKIYDRSGNNYSLYLITNDSDLSVIPKIVPNTSITFTCNRDPSEIQRFEIYRDNELLKDVSYSQTLTFKESGEYRVVVVDWFSNSFDETFVFTRTLEGIQWRYNGILYEEDMEGMSKVQIDSHTENIYTNGKLAVLYPMGSAYSYRFEGYTPQTTVSSYVGGMTMISIDATKSYTLILYYTDFEDVEMVYNVSVDMVAPIINVFIQESDYTHNEVEELNAYVDDVIANPSHVKSELEGKDFIPTNIGYSIKEGSEIDHYLADGALISSKLIEVSLTDESPVTRCDVYLDETLLMSFDNASGVADFTLSRYGKYKIEAYDILGNKSTFTFNNALSNGTTVDVDGVESLEKENFGSQSYTLKTQEEGTVLFLIKCGEKKFFYYFDILEGIVYQESIKYSTTVLEDLSINPIMIKSKEVFVESQVSSYRFDIDNDTKVKENIIDNNYLIFVLKKVDGFYNFSFELRGTDEFEIITKSYGGKFEPFYNECILSGKSSSIKIITPSGERDVENDSLIFLNDSFEINESCITSDIASVIVKDSAGKEMQVYPFINELKRAVFSGNGTYKIYITNIYGITSVSTITVSDTFSIIKTSYLKGEEENPINYSADYNATIKSNGQVKLYILSTNPTIYATVNEKIYTPEIVKQTDKTVITISSDGHYVFVISDEFGNSETVEVEINYKALLFPKDLLTGYNMGSTTVNDYYTKNTLSLNNTSRINNDISYIEISYEGKKLVVYDTLSEARTLGYIEMISEMMTQNGSGTYTVTIRDSYGNKSQKTIHYKAESPLILSRTTRSDGNYTSYLIDEIDGEFCSNNSVRIETNANNYECLMNGEKVELPKVITYGRDAETCVFNYYDEYGFNYEITVKLYRAEIVIEANNLEKFKDVNGILTTNDNFSVQFTKEASCVYLLNGETFEYKGEEIRRDGVYRFTAIDSAGNIATATYKKDSICEYQFVDQMSGKILVSGDIANYQNIVFKIKNQDTCYIKDAYLDGVKLKNLNDDRFIETGYYEFLIADEAGNESFFDFYVISHPVKGLEYQTPYTYIIQSIVCETNYGEKIPKNAFVDNLGNYSKFSFGTKDDDNIIRDDDGLYTVTMYSSVYGNYSTFTFTINNDMPLCELVGCSEGEETLNNITIKGFSVGDTIKIYKDGNLTKTILITSKVSEVPEISSGGEYVITITNQAGLTQTLSFTRTHIANAAGNVLIILSAVVINIFLFVGLVYRTKTKIDD